MARSVATLPPVSVPRYPRGSLTKDRASRAKARTRAAATGRRSQARPLLGGSLTVGAARTGWSTVAIPVVIGALDGLFELPAEVVDLVPQPGRVLEAEVGGRVPHLLLEGADEAGQFLPG